MKILSNTKKFIISILFVVLLATVMACVDVNVNGSDKYGNVTNGANGSVVSGAVTADEAKTCTYLSDITGKVSAKRLPSLRRCCR